MKALKAIFATVILALALSVPAYAGDLQTPGYTPPPPPPGLTITVDVPTDTSSALGDISCPGFVDILWVLASIF